MCPVHGIALDSSGSIVHPSNLAIGDSIVVVWRCVNPALNAVTIAGPTIIGAYLYGTADDVEVTARDCASVDFVNPVSAKSHYGYVAYYAGRH